LGEDETAVETDPMGEPTAEEPTGEELGVVEPPAEDPPVAAQLSLDEMVESLRVPEEDAEALLSGTDTADPDTAGEAAADTADTVSAGDATASDTGSAPAEPPLAPAEPPSAATSDFPHLARSRRLGARLPFWLYAGAWLLFAAGMAIAMWPYATASFTAHPLYAWFVLGGAGLAVLGPVIAVVAWLVLRSGSDPEERAGLVRALFLRASVALLAGSLLWWAALIALDLRRAGLLG
jgi:hypothetical protein